jgi:replicative DNA helicase
MAQNHDREDVLRLERAVLGGMLRDAAVVADVFAVLRPPDFWAASHGLIADAILSLWQQGKPVNVASVADLLHGRGQIGHGKEVSYERLAAFWANEPTGATAGYLAGLLRGKALLRRLAAAGRQIAEAAETPTDDPESLLADAERQILALSQVGVSSEAVHAAQVVDEVFARIDARQKGQVQAGLTTGYPDLDELTAGLHDGEFSIIAARTSVGKTGFALCLLSHIVLQLGKPALFVSLEQSRLELVERMLCARAEVNTHRVRSGKVSREDVQRLTAVGDLLRSSGLWLDDWSNQTVTRIAATARRLKARKDIGVVMVDYLQLVEPEDRRVNRVEQIAAVSRRLKTLARELKIPVVAMAQLNRDADGRRPKLSDLREGGSQEQDTDTVFLLHREEDPDDHQLTDLVECIVAKQRNGRIGSVKLVFQRSFVRFDSYQESPPELAAAPAPAAHGNGRHHDGP